MRSNRNLIEEKKMQTSLRLCDNFPALVTKQRSSFLASIMVIVVFQDVEYDIPAKKY